MKKVLLMMLMFLFVTTNVYGIDITLMYNASVGATGYKLCFGKTSRGTATTPSQFKYINEIDVKNVITYKIPNFDKTYGTGKFYFAVVAYNTFAMSEYSNTCVSSSNNTCDPISKEVVATITSIPTTTTSSIIPTTTSTTSSSTTTTTINKKKPRNLRYYGEIKSGSNPAIWDWVVIQWDVDPDPTAKFDIQLIENVVGTTAGACHYNVKFALTSSQVVIPLFDWCTKFPYSMADVTVKATYKNLNDNSTISYDSDPIFIDGVCPPVK